MKPELKELLDYFDNVEPASDSVALLVLEVHTLITTNAELREQVERLRQLLRWAHDTLYEINPSNYDHDEVCKLNDASVEVILGIAPELGETHGKSPDWWKARDEAAERAAVKVKLMDTAMAPGCCSAISPCSHQQRDKTTLCDVCARANALSPAESEPGQEVVAWEWAVFEDGMQRGSWTPRGYGDEAGWKAIANRNPDKYKVVIRPLYTRPPSERAVTEALRRALTTMQWCQRAGYGDDVFVNDLCQSIRVAKTALTAAMEAKR